MGNPHSISAETLAAMIGTGAAPTIVDVCLPEDFACDPRVIPTARRMDFKDAANTTWPERDLVIVCQKGLKLSQGVAASLRARGVNARYLEGGMKRWAQAQWLLLEVELHAAIGGAQQSWVISQDWQPEDLFAAWHVARLVDPDPTWFIVERDQCRLSPTGLMHLTHSDYARSFNMSQTRCKTGLWPFEGRWSRLEFGTC